MKKFLMASVAAALMMTGCANTSTNTNSTTPVTTTPSSTNTTKVAPVSPMAAQTFSCNIGLDVTVKHLGNDQIELVTSPDVKRAVLTQAPSGSGERYVTSTGLWGQGGEWHQKGNEAHFSYVGVHGGTPKSAVCTAK
ncbi:MAG: MliC family protein [Moraxella sp.]|nr:MliC family protein [Moraxella sp.]